MAYGACSSCGCSHEECLRDGECDRKPLPPAPRPGGRKKTGGIHLIPGDWVRVRRGHRLEGAAGAVKIVNRKNQPALVTFRQLNGNELRLPLGLLEFVGYRGEEPDVL